jgi:hypothetical protein
MRANELDFSHVAIDMGWIRDPVCFHSQNFEAK